MRNAKLGGKWVKDAQVFVNGDSEANNDPRSWGKVAVLEVHPRNTPFFVGWRTEPAGTAEFYPVPVEPLDAQFGMAVGDQDVWFVVRAVDGQKELVVELVECTTRDDPKYPNLPCY